MTFLVSTFMCFTGIPASLPFLASLIKYTTVAIAALGINKIILKTNKHYLYST